MDNNELKVQALLERISKIVAEYENDKADFRVQYTMLRSHADLLEREVEGYRSKSNGNPIQPKYHDAVQGTIGEANVSEETAPITGA